MAAPGGPGASTENTPASLSVICKFWEDLDLESLRRNMDDVGMSIAEHQEESVHNRRKLAETTRDFKKTASEAALKGVGALLKAYQVRALALALARAWWLPHRSAGC